MSQSTRPTGYSPRYPRQQRQRRIFSPWTIGFLLIVLALLVFNVGPRLTTLMGLDQGSTLEASLAPETQIVHTTSEVPDASQPGTCSERSTFVPRTNAWRCTVGDASFDPCFGIVEGAAVSVVCGAEPLSGAPGFVVEGAGGSLPTPSPEVRPLTPGDLAWIEYTVDLVGTPVKLVNGQFYMPALERAGGSVLIALSEMQEMGDLDGDGDDDAAVLLVADADDDRMFIYLGAVLNQNGTPVALGTVELGDRVKVDDLDIHDGQITVRMMTHTGDDPQCCPTLDAERSFNLVGDWLVPWLDGWRLELTGGVQCQPVQAQQAAGSTMPFAYQCSDGAWLRNGLFPGRTWYALPVASLANVQGVIVTSPTAEDLIPIVRLWQ